CSRADDSFLTLMPNSLSSITTISSASMESSPRPPLNNGSLATWPSGVMSPTLSRSIRSSFSFRRRSVIASTFLHRCGRRQPIPFDPRRDRPEALLQSNQGEEQFQFQAIAPAGKHVSSEDAHDGAHEAEPFARL